MSKRSPQWSSSTANARCSGPRRSLFYASKPQTRQQKETNHSSLDSPSVRVFTRHGKLVLRCPPSPSPSFTSGSQLTPLSREMHTCISPAPVPLELRKATTSVSPTASSSKKRIFSDSGVEGGVLIQEHRNGPRVAKFESHSIEEVSIAAKGAIEFIIGGPNYMEGRLNHSQGCSGRVVSCSVCCSGINRHWCAPRETSVNGLVKKTSWSDSYSPPRPT